MDRDAHITQSLNELLADHLKGTEVEVQLAVGAASASGNLHNSRFPMVLAGIYEQRFGGAALEAAKKLEAIERAAAPAKAGLLEAALRAHAEQMVSALRSHVERTAIASRMEAGSDQIRRLQDALSRRVGGVLRDLHLGAVGSEPIATALQHSVTVDARGGNANVVVGSPGATVSVGRDMTVSAGVDLAALRDLLAQAKAEVDALPDTVDPEVRLDVQDRIAHARLASSVALEEVDHGLLMRTIKGLAPRLENVGLNIVSNALCKLMGI